MSEKKTFMVNCTTINLFIVAACLLNCVLSSPCHGQQAPDRILLDWPKTAHPEGWNLEGYAFGL